MPEDKLQRQSATFRHQFQNQKATKYKQIPDTNATVIGYNADIGANVIQLPDGSISYAKSDTNGALALSDNVPLHQGTNRIDGLPSIETAIKIKKKKSFTPLTYNLRVLVIAPSALDKTILLAGSESKPIKEIYQFPYNEEQIYFTNARIDNSNIKDADGWVVTSLWIDDSLGNTIIDSPGYAISFDKTNSYETYDNNINFLSIAGAHFFSLSNKDDFYPFVSTNAVNGSFDIVTQTDGIGTVTNEEITINHSNTATSDNRFGGIFNYSVSPENPRNNNREYYSIPYTVTKIGSTTIPAFFTGSSFSSASIDYSYIRTRLNDGNYQNDFNMSINSDFTLNTNQGFSSIYRGITTQVFSSTSENYSFTGSINYEGSYHEATGGINFSDNSTYNYYSSPVTINMLPNAAPEVSFEQETDYTQVESGIHPFLTSGYFYLGAIGQTLFTGSNKLYQYVDPTVFPYINPSNYLAQDFSDVFSYGEKIASISSPGLSHNIKNKYFIPLLISPSGNEGIILKDDVHTAYHNIITSGETQNGTPFTNRYTVQTYPYLSIGRYFYQITSEGVSKKLIEFSGYKRFTNNLYLDQSENYINRNSISTLSYKNINSYNHQGLPEIIELNQVVVFDLSDGYQWADVNQVLEFEYSSPNQIAYGEAVVTQVDFNTTSIRISAITTFTSSEKTKYNLEFLFGNGEGIFFELNSRGGGILNYLGYSGFNVSLSQKKAYKVRVISFDDLYNQRPYYVFVDTYSIETYNNGDTVYLRKQKPQFIKCPAIAVDNIEKVIFSYAS